MCLSRSRSRFSKLARSDPEIVVVRAFSDLATAGTRRTLRESPVACVSTGLAGDDIESRDSGGEAQFPPREEKR
jgi:hypothetical protein